MATTPCIRSIVLAIKLARDSRHSAAAAVGSIAAAGIQTDSAGREHETPYCLYTTEAEQGQVRADPTPLPLPQALGALCEAAQAFRPHLVVTHGAAFLNRYLPGLVARLTPKDPRPACTRRLARQLWPDTPEFNIDNLCYARDLIEDDALQHPDFPVRMNSLWEQARDQRWGDAALGAMLFGDICRTVGAGGREVTPELLRERSHVQLQLRAPSGRHAGRLWADVPCEDIRQLLHDDQFGHGPRLDPVVVATLEAALCGVYAAGPRPDEPGPR